MSVIMINKKHNLCTKVRQPEHTVSRDARKEVRHFSGTIWTRCWSSLCGRRWSVFLPLTIRPILVFNCPADSKINIFKANLSHKAASIELYHKVCLNLQYINTYFQFEIFYSLILLLNCRPIAIKLVLTRLMRAAIKLLVLPLAHYILPKAIQHWMLVLIVRL